MNRRHLLGSIPLLALVGCTSGAGTSTTISTLLSPQNIALAQNVVTTLSAVENTVATNFPKAIPASTADTLNGILTTAQSAAGQLPSLATAANQGTTLASVVSGGSQVLNIMAAVLPAAGVSPEVIMALQAASFAVKALGALAATLVPATTTGAVPLNSRFTSPTMTLDQANLILAENALKAGHRKVR